MRIRLFAGIWLTACTYPIVAVVLPSVIDVVNDRLRYLIVAESIAHFGECLLFYLAFGRAEPRTRRALVQDMVAVFTANWASFTLGEVANVMGWFNWLPGIGVGFSASN